MWKLKRLHGHCQYHAATHADVRDGSINAAVEAAVNFEKDGKLEQYGVCRVL